MANSTTLYTGQDGRTWVDVTEAKVLTNAQSGIVQNVLTDAIVVTLPATAVAEFYVIRNGGDNPSGAAYGAVGDASMAVNVSPNSADLINGLAFSPSDNKDAINTKATAKVGDEIQLVGNNGDGWNIVKAIGTWAREA